MKFTDTEVKLLLEYANKFKEKENKSYELLYAGVLNVEPANLVVFLSDKDNNMYASSFKITDNNFCNITDLLKEA